MKALLQWKESRRTGDWTREQREWKQLCSSRRALRSTSRLEVKSVHDSRAAAVVFSLLSLLVPHLQLKRHKLLLLRLPSYLRQKRQYTLTLRFTINTTENATGRSLSLRKASFPGCPEVVTFDSSKMILPNVCISLCLMLVRYFETKSYTEDAIHSLIERQAMNNECVMCLDFPSFCFICSLGLSPGKSLEYLSLISMLPLFHDDMLMVLRATRWKRNSHFDNKESSSQRKEDKKFCISVIMFINFSGWGFFFLFSLSRP